MKISLKPNKTRLVNTAALSAGAVVGHTLSKGADEYLPKEQKSKTISKAVIAGLSFYMASAIASKGMASEGMKGVFIGAGVEKSLSLIRDMAASSSIATEDATGKPVLRFAKTALGLNGCGCSTASRYNSTMRIPKLNYANINRIYPDIQMRQTLDNAFEIDYESLLRS